MKTKRQEYSGVSNLVIGANGYIGSALTGSLDCFSVDKDWVTNFRDESEMVHNFKTIILLGGFSSVSACEKNPEASWFNNVEFFRRILSAVSGSQRLIYASSASVYGSTLKATEGSPLPPPVKNYDLQKQTIDLIAQQQMRLGKNIVGLRFGTVNGLSPVTRVDLIVNSMVHNAIVNNIIPVSNEKSSRSILFLPDLLRAIQIILETPNKSGIYNLSSFDSTIGEIAKSVSELLDTPVEQSTSENNYSFTITSEKFMREFGKFSTTDFRSLVQDLHSGLTSVERVRRD